jgi:hypothetical protein
VEWGGRQSSSGSLGWIEMLANIFKESRSFRGHCQRPISGSYNLPVGPRSNLEKKETKIVGSNLGNFIFMM